MKTLTPMALVFDAHSTVKTPAMCVPSENRIIMDSWFHGSLYNNINY